MSTKRLLRGLNRSVMVQADASYKVVWQGYPILLMGTTDKSQTFHPFVLAVCKGESKEDFAFIFRALHAYNPQWLPTILLGDACEAILAGFTLVFGPPLVRLMCYFHVRKNIEPYYRALSKNARRQLQCDVQALQNCQDASTFLKAVPLFLKKWTAIHPDFVKYFREQWISKNYQWFEGAAVGQPSSNNGLEATNGVIKSEHTMRERLPVGQFLSTTLEIVLQWSETRDPESANCIEYATTPKVSLPQWTKAYQWAVEKKTVIEEAAGTFFTASSTSIQITKKRLKQYKEAKWRTFDEFIQLNNGV